MKPLSETFKELGIAFKFPIEIRDADGNETYREDSDGYCYKYEWDAKGNATYYENSNDYCRKWERDAKGNETYYEDSDGITRGTPRIHPCASHAPNHLRLVDLCEELIGYLEAVEESDSGREFHPTTIASCRCMVNARLEEIIPEIKSICEL